MKKILKKLIPSFLIFLFAAFIQVESVAAFTFGVAGDFANGTIFQHTTASVKAKNPDFQLAVGDLAYTTAEQSWCNTWKSTAGYNNIILVSGNHDSGEDLSGNINTYSQYCPFTLTSQLTGTYGKQYYFDYPQTNPTARFILLTPGLGGSFIGFNTNYTLGSQGYIFTQNAIDNARTKGIPWVIVGMHKNCLSMGTKSCEIGSDLMNLLINKRVDMVLQGHDHNYQRSKQLTCATVNSYNPSCVANSGSTGSYTKGAGTIFLIQGVGGQNQYTINTADSEVGYFAKWAGQNSNQTFGFNLFNITSTQLSSQFVKNAQDGGTFTDNFTITTSTATPTTVLPTNTPTPLPLTPTNTPSLTPTPTPIPTGDFNHDGITNLIDLSSLLSNFNSNNITYDLNGDGIINSVDFFILVNILKGNGIIQ